MNESPLHTKAKHFALNIVILCKEIQKEQREYVLTKQLVRSGTSIGANLHESRRAQSKKDFYAKICIASKEASETEYWIILLRDSKYIESKMAQSLLSALSQLSAIKFQLST